MDAADILIASFLAYSAVRDGECRNPGRQRNVVVQRLAPAGGRFEPGAWRMRTKLTW